MGKVEAFLFNVRHGAREVVDAWRYLLAGTACLAFAVAAPHFFPEGSRSLIQMVAVASAMWLMNYPVVASRLRAAQLRDDKLYRFILSVRDYAVDNIEPLRASVDVLQGVRSDVPPTEMPSGAAEVPEGDLTTRERNNLLAIIGVLCKAHQIDLSRPSVAAKVVKSMADTERVRIPESTIEQHLKRAKTAMGEKKE